jgi:hypothetical protein
VLRTRRRRSRKILSVSRASACGIEAGSVFRLKRGGKLRERDRRQFAWGHAGRQQAQHAPRDELADLLQGAIEILKTDFARLTRQIQKSRDDVGAIGEKLPDEAERIRALTDLAATLLVEAAAGTGKTSLLALACEFLTRGAALPGQDADAAENDLRLAMPASPSYLRRKRSAFAKASGRLAGFWDAR